jgi:site-specific recombinase XerD
VPGYLAGRPPRSKGRRYPADPPRTEEIIAVMRCCGDGLHGARARGLIVVLWRAGLRIQEALDLTELDLDRRRGSVLERSRQGRPPARGRHGRLGPRATRAMAAGAYAHAGRAAVLRDQRPHPRSRVASLGSAGALRRRATRAGVRRRFAPHQLRHAHALDLLREAAPLNVTQRQLGHRNLGMTSIYLKGIDPDEIIQTVHAHRPPMIPASVGLALPRPR